MDLFLGKNVNDEDVYCVSINGMAIYNPHMSECGRFAVNPLEYYGLTDNEVLTLENINKTNGFNTEV